MDTDRRASARLGAGIAVFAVVLASWGVAGRDLAGDELNMLHGSPAQIFEWSLDPRDGFVGHLPLSFWARWLSLSIWTEVPTLAWRLHALVFTGLAAAVTASTAHRHFGRWAGVLAGVLVAVDPIVQFHAQEAGNYAASVLTGALIVRGVLDLRADHSPGAGWLGAGLLLGATNDYYSVLLAGPALLASIVLARSPRVRRHLIAAWVLPALCVAPFVLLFASRLFEATGGAVVDVHADPLPPRPLPAVVDAFWRAARRFFGAHLHGYAGGRNDAPWLGLPPVLFAVTALGASLRGRAWPAALLVVGALLLHGLLGVGLQLGADRVLPFEPRSLIGLTPALAIGLAAHARRDRPMVTAVCVAWLVGAGLATLEARLDPADLRARAIAHARSVAPDVPLIIPEDRTRTRAPGALPCVPDGAVAFAVITDHTASSPPWCGNGPVPHPSHRRAFDAPVYEGSAASFLPRRVVAIYGQGVPAAPLVVRRALWDGLSDATWALTDPQGATLARGNDPARFSRPADTAMLAAQPTAPTWLPDHSLLRAHRNQVQGWELDPLDQQPVLDATPLRAPLVSSLRSLLPIVGWGLALFAVGRRR